MKHPQAAFLVFAKAPVPGQVKTRLIPALGTEGAARLHRELLYGLIERLIAADLATIELWCAPDTSHADFQVIHQRYGASLHAQCGDDLGQRMAHAVTDAGARHRHLLLLGVDCPALTDTMLDQALIWLAEGDDAVLGPAEDGGYVLLGLKGSADCLFQNIPWSTDRVAGLTRDCLRQLDWRWRELPRLRDLDRPEDLAYFASLPGRG